MNDNLVEHWTKQIMMMGAEQKYPVFKVFLMQGDSYSEYLWEAVASFRHGHDVLVADVSDYGQTAAEAVGRLYNRLRVMYRDNLFAVFQSK